MALMPKRVKFRKWQRGKLKGHATKGNTVAYGEFGLQSLGTSWITAQQIEAGRVAATIPPGAGRFPDGRSARGPRGPAARAVRSFQPSPPRARSAPGQVHRSASRSCALRHFVVSPASARPFEVQTRTTTDGNIGRTRLHGTGRSDTSEEFGLGGDTGGRRTSSSMAARPAIRDRNA